MTHSNRLCKAPQKSVGVVNDNQYRMVKQWGLVTMHRLSEVTGKSKYLKAAKLAFSREDANGIKTFTSFLYRP